MRLFSDDISLSLSFSPSPLPFQLFCFFFFLNYSILRMRTHRKECNLQ